MLFLIYVTTTVVTYVTSQNFSSPVPYLTEEVHIPFNTEGSGVSIETEVNEESLLTTESLTSKAQVRTEPTQQTTANALPQFLFSTNPLLSTERTKTISKRAAEYYNGIVGSQFYYSFNPSKPSFPIQAVTGMGRPLQRGSSLPRTEYVALWAPRGAAPHWGTVYADANNNIEGTFIDNSRVMNLTSPEMSSASVRLLQYVGTESSNNFKFDWTLARNVDPTTVLTQKQAGMCSPRVAPAVFQDGSYEFLGEADIDNRVMRYIHQGHVNIVEKSHFTNNVYLLTMRRCSCSCR